MQADEERGNGGSHLQTAPQRDCVGGCLESSLNSSVGPRQSASTPGRRQSATKTRQSAVSSRHSSSPGSGATKSQAQASSSCYSSSLGSAGPGASTEAAEKGTSNCSGRQAGTDAKKSTSCVFCGRAAARSARTTNVRAGARASVDSAESTPT